MGGICRQLISMVTRQSPGPPGEDIGVMGMLLVQNDINLDTTDIKYTVAERRSYRQREMAMMGL